MECPFQIGEMVAAVPVSEELRFEIRAINARCTIKVPFASIEDGRIYTVRDIDSRFADEHGVPTVRVEEVINVEINTARGVYELGYHPRRFRKVRRTDISSLVKLLAPSPKEKVGA